MGYPTSLPSYAGFTSTHTLSQDNHAAQHNSEQADITALGTKVGTGASTPTNATVLRGNGTGTSTWGQLNAQTDITGILAQANGGTGTNTATGTGSPVYSTNPTITNAIISADSIPGYTSPNTGTIYGVPITSATINGSSLATTSVPNTALASGIQTSKFSNPYKFSVYRNTALNSSNGFTLITFDTKTFDTGGNYSTSTGSFTAPVSGFYQFGWTIGASSTTTGFWISNLYKNGASVLVGSYGGSATSFAQSVGSAFLQLAANDFIQVYVQAQGVNAIATGSLETSFMGYLVSMT